MIEEDDLGIGDKLSDDRVSLIDEYDDHNSSAFTTAWALNYLELYDSSAFTTPLALNYLELYDSQIDHKNRNSDHVLNFVKQFQGL